jgi:protein ImuB
MLWIAIDLPDLPLEAFPRASASVEPRAVSESGRVLVCDACAQALGVRPGMRLSAACALVPQLTHRPRDAASEAAALQALATWGLKFTPNVSLERPRALLLDIEGSLRLFGGIRPILEALERDLETMGYQTALACAPTPTAALLLARGGRRTIVNSRRGLEAAVATLPPAALTGDAAMLQSFGAIGVRCIGDLLRLPRDGLARRFGPDLTDTIDRALGKQPAPRRFFTPPAQFSARLELPAPVAQAQALLFAAKRLLVQLAGFLASRNGGIQRCTLRFEHEERAPSVIDIGLVAPSRDEERLVLLARERLAVFALPEPAEAIALEADEILGLAPDSGSLFLDRANRPGEWEKLVERLRARLGTGAVHGLAACPEHRPEYAWRVAEPGTKNAAPECGPRPLWLLENPQPLSEIGDRPHDRHGPLALVAGPERIESGWWDGNDVMRDYFIAHAVNRATLWIYRERRRPGGWYLHGIFG